MGTKAPYSENELNPQKLLFGAYQLTLQNHYKKFVLIFLITTVTVLIFYKNWPKQFNTSVSLLVTSQQPSIPSSGDSTSQMVLLGGLLSSSENKQKILNLLNSRTLAEHVIEDVQLHKYYPNTKNLVLEKNLKSSLAAKFKKEILSINSRKIDLLELSIKAPDPQLSLLLATSITKQLKQMLDTMLITSAKRNEMFFLREVEKAATEVDIAQAKLSDYQKSHKLANSVTGIQNFQSNYANILARTIQSETQLRFLRSYLTPDSPYLKTETDQLAAFKEQLQALEIKAFNGSKNLGGTGVNKVSNLTRLEREFTFKQLLYESLEKQYYISKTESGKEALDFEILDPPLLPTGPSIPDPFLTLVLSITLLLCLEFFVFWILHRKTMASLKYSNFTFGDSKESGNVETPARYQ